MHSHDLDLIAAYAEGSLDGDADEARRLVEACPECRAEYELQNEVRDSLRAAPPVSFTGAERMRVRTAVFEEVGRGADVVGLASRRTRRWMTIGTVAAALLVLVGLGGALVQLRGGTQAASGGLTSLAQDEADTAAEDGADPRMMVAPADTTTTAAALESGASPGADTDLGPLTIDELREAVERVIADAERTAPEERRPPRTSDGAAESCIDRVTDPAVGSIRATVDGDPVVVYVTEADGGIGAEAFHLDGCMPLNLD